MALTLERLIALRDALIENRAKGWRRYMIDGLSVEYQSDAEMAAALADLNRQIAAAQGARPTQVKVSTSKGL